MSIAQMTSISFLPEICQSLDKSFWVPKSAFFAHFDQDDFHCRDSFNVVASYLQSWFDIYDDGIFQFKLPMVLNCTQY